MSGGELLLHRGGRMRRGHVMVGTEVTCFRQCLLLVMVGVVACGYVNA
jgi:hypothetical protein